MSTSRSFVTIPALPCAAVTSCTSAGITGLAGCRLVGFAAFAGFGGWNSARCVGRAAAAFCIPAYFQCFGCNLHCQSKTECPSLLHAGQHSSVGRGQSSLECFPEQSAHFGAAIHEACLCPYLLQLKHGRLLSRFSHFEQYAPVAPKIAVPDWSKCSAATLLLSQITSDPTFLSRSTLLSQCTFIAVRSCSSLALSFAKFWHTSFLSVFPSPTSLSITACFATISHLTGNHSSPLTLVPGICSVAHCVCFLAFSACSLSSKTTSILSPGPGRRNAIFEPSVAFALSRPF